jgi:hypothetical protein
LKRRRRRRSRIRRLASASAAAVVVILVCETKLSSAELACNEITVYKSTCALITKHMSFILSDFVIAFKGPQTHKCVLNTIMVSLRETDGII